MKKILLIIAMFIMSIVAFSQAAPPEKSDLSKLTINSIPPSTAPSDGYKTSADYMRSGIWSFVWGGVFIGTGAVCLAYQSSPYAYPYYDSSWRFWTGVTFCTLGGLELILGIANVAKANVMLNEERKISLTPAKKDFGIAINF